MRIKKALKIKKYFLQNLNKKFQISCKQRYNKSIFPGATSKNSNFCLKTNIYSNVFSKLNLDNRMQKQLFFKKSLYFLNIDKIRYRDFGYTFFCTKKFKNSSLFYFFRIFSKFNQSVFHQIQTTNIGKYETGISKNGYFFGKEQPDVLTYYFPKNSETLTGGVFFYEPAQQVYSHFTPQTYFIALKKQKFWADTKKSYKFLCSKRQFVNFSGAKFLPKIMPLYIFQKYNQNFLFLNFVSVSKKFSICSYWNTKKNFVTKKNIHKCHL